MLGGVPALTWTASKNVSKGAAEVLDWVVAV